MEATVSCICGVRVDGVVTDEKIPLSVRVRCAARAAVACLRADYTLQMVPVRRSDRVPMCSTLAQCARNCHRVEQAEAKVAELEGVSPR